MTHRLPRTFSQRSVTCALLLGLALVPAVLRGQAAASAQVLQPQEVEHTFPPSVYFSGKTAPIQMRNASAVRLPRGLFFAGLIDNSGYASAVQEKYQMYLLLDGPVTFGGKALPAGAYGAGFVGSRFLVMDVGGHTLLEGDTQTDAQMTRPRPLQLVQTGATGLRLYLGKRWVEVTAVPAK